MQGALAAVNVQPVWPLIKTGAAPCLTQRVLALSAPWSVQVVAGPWCSASAFRLVLLRHIVLLCVGRYDAPL